MEIDPHGKVVKHTITQTVINTTFRMTYSDVNDILAGDEEKAQEFKKIVPSIHQMATPAWNSRRHADSAEEPLNFDTNEAKILVR